MKTSRDIVDPVYSSRSLLSALTLRTTDEDGAARHGASVERRAPVLERERTLIERREPRFRGD
jgi:hypothetical protein